MKSAFVLYLLSCFVSCSIASTGFMLESVRRNILDLVPAEDFAAVGRVFDRVSDHLVNRHPESELRSTAG